MLTRCRSRAVGCCSGVAAYACGACSRSTGRCSSPPAPSRSSPTGCSGRWSPWALLVLAAAAHAGSSARCWRDRRVPLVLLAGAAVVITRQLGDLHLRRQQRPRGRDLARLLHQPAGHRADGGRSSSASGCAALQWVAIGVGDLAVVVLTVDYGRLPWVALVLAFSFGTYGLAKKTADVGAVESLTFETPAHRAVRGGVPRLAGAPRAVRRSAPHGAGHALLLATTGIVTAVPLICFGAAAIRVSMVTLGLLQYLAPILQFVLGVLLVPRGHAPGRWIGFAPGLGRAGDLHRRGGRATAAASCGRQRRRGRRRI